MPVSRRRGFAPGPAADRPIDVPRVLSLHYGRQNTACADEKAERGMAATVVGGRVEDALELPARGIDILEIPLDPSHLWELAG